MSSEPERATYENAVHAHRWPDPTCRLVAELIARYLDSGRVPGFTQRYIAAWLGLTDTRAVRRVLTRMAADGALIVKADEGVPTGSGQRADAYGLTLAPMTSVGLRSVLDERAKDAARREGPGGRSSRAKAGPVGPVKAGPVGPVKAGPVGPVEIRGETTSGDEARVASLLADEVLPARASPRDEQHDEVTAEPAAAAIDEWLSYAPKPPEVDAILECAAELLVAKARGNPVTFVATVLPKVTRAIEGDVEHGFPIDGVPCERAKQYLAQADVVNLAERQRRKRDEQQAAEDERREHVREWAAGCLAGMEDDDEGRARWIDGCDGDARAGGEPRAIGAGVRAVLRQLAAGAAS